MKSKSSDTDITNIKNIQEDDKPSQEGVTSNDDTGSSTPSSDIISREDNLFKGSKTKSGTPPPPSNVEVVTANLESDEHGEAACKRSYSVGDEFDHPEYGHCYVLGVESDGFMFVKSSKYTLNIKIPPVDA